MQHVTYSNGAFALHKVEGKYSCYFDKDGTMIDCESLGRKHSLNPAARTYAIKHNSATWQRLSKLGAVFKLSAGTPY